MEIAKILKEFPPAPDDIREWILTDVVKGKYMIYSVAENRAVCTHCKTVFEFFGREVRIGKLTHNEEMTCPHCGKKVICKKKGVGRKNLLEMTRVITFARKGKSIYAMLSDIDISFEKELPEIRRGVVAIYKFNHKEQVYLKHSYGYFSPMLGQLRDEGWNAPKKIRVPSPPRGSFYFPPKRWGLHVYDRNFKDVFNKSDLKYLNVPRFYKERKLSGEQLIIYLELASKYQSIELLQKAGFEALVIDRINDCGKSRAVNWRGTDLRKILGIDKRFIRELQKHGSVRMDEFFCFKDYIKKGKPVSITEAILIDETYPYSKEKIEKVMKFKKAVSYIANQNEVNRQKNKMPDYADYLEDCKKLGLDIRKKKVLFPEDFKTAHKNLAELVETEKSRKMDVKIKENSLKISGMADPYLFGGFLIKPVQRSEELREESSVLGHCVKTYADRIAGGECTILFIRKQDTPEIPFYTLELSRKGEIVQCRGTSNCSMTEEVKAFVDRWHKEVILGKKPKAKKQKKVA